MEALALALHSQGRIDEAEKIQREVVQKEQQQLGMEHPFTLIAMHNLVPDTYSHKKDEAKELYRYVIQTRKKVLRKGHLYTLGCMKNLANLLREMARTKRRMRSSGRFQISGVLLKIVCVEETSNRHFIDRHGRLTKHYTVQADPSTELSPGR